MIVDIAANNEPDQTKFCCVEFIFRRGKMFKFSTLCDRLSSSVFLVLSLLSFS